MGAWLGAIGRLRVEPEPDDDLIRDYIVFCQNTHPKEYRDDEVFANSWYFDELTAHTRDFSRK